MELISKLLDETISEQEFAAFHEMLESSSSLRQIYLQAVDQEIELSCRESCELITVPFKEPLASRSNILGLAALIFLSLLAVFIFRPLDRANPSIVEIPPPSVDPGNLRPVPPAPDQWVENFEGGMPAGWEAEFVSTGLPDGSRGAIRTISLTKNGIDYRNITPPMSWAPGYVKVGPNTHLHITFRVDQFAYFNLFMLTHVTDPNRNDVGLYQHPGVAMNAKPGTWQKISVPLRLFQRKNANLGVFVDGGPDEGEVVWQLFVSAANQDLDLVIDEWQVDQQGPGVVTVTDI